MRIRTSFARGWGIGRWRSLRTFGGPGLDMTMAFMVDMLMVLGGFGWFWIIWEDGRETTFKLLDRII